MVQYLPLKRVVAIMTCQALAAVAVAAVPPEVAVTTVPVAAGVA
jgi:hypothetical protein